MSDSRNVEIIREVYAAFVAGDLELALGRVAPGAVWEGPETPGVPWGGTRHGREGAASFFAAIDDAAEVELFEPRTFVAQGDAVVVLGFERLRVKATGRTYESHWAHAFTLKDGKIVRYREYADTAAVAAAFRPEG